MAQARRSAPIRPSEPPGCPPRKDLDRPNHRIRGKTGRFRTIRSRKHPRVRPWKLFSSLHPTSTPRKKLRSPLTSLASPSPELAVSPGLRSDTTSRSHPDCRFATPPSPFALRGARRPSTLATPTVVERGHAYRHLHTFCPNLPWGRDRSSLQVRHEDLHDLVPVPALPHTPAWPRGMHSRTAAAALRPLQRLLARGYGRLQIPGNRQGGPVDGDRLPKGLSTAAGRRRCCRTPRFD